MSQATLFSHWLDQHVPQIRAVFSEVQFTAKYLETEGIYELYVETPDYDDILLVIFGTDSLSVKRALVMVGRNIDTLEPVMETIKGAQHMTIAEILTIARSVQESYRAG